MDQIPVTGCYLFWGDFFADVVVIDVTVLIFIFYFKNVMPLNFLRAIENGIEYFSGYRYRV